jgi:alpha-lytic endopeptidase
LHIAQDEKFRKKLPDVARGATRDRYVYLRCIPSRAVRRSTIRRRLAHDTALSPPSRSYIGLAPRRSDSHPAQEAQPAKTRNTQSNGDSDMQGVRQFRSIFLSPNRRLPLAIALCAAMFVPLGANATQPGDPQLGKELLNAMRRDLGLDAQQAAQYVRTERAAIALAPRLEADLGTAYAGSWLERDNNGQFRLVAATTDVASATKARALGAEVRVVRHSIAQLNAAKSKLDALSKQRRPTADIHSWYTDPKSNLLVIEGELTAGKAALDFATASGIDPSLVTFRKSNGKPTLSSIVGGERYNMPGGRACSIGFPVTRGADTGFATAGHCGTVGTTTTGTNGVVQGVFEAREHPNRDSAWVRITNPGAWPLINSVNNYAGGSVAIAGQIQAPIGAAVCRSGLNTGYRCGTITAHDTTVFYSAGPVYGLSRSTACAGAGDSGGSVITPGGQAQGVHSGSNRGPNENNTCASAQPEAYYQPIVPLLNQYGLTLFTGASAQPPVISAYSCTWIGSNRYQCFVNYSGATPATVTFSPSLTSSGTQSNTPGSSTIQDLCRTSGSTISASVTVSNAFGSATRNTSFICF